jgi:hypothetical protein
LPVLGILFFAAAFAMYFFFRHYENARVLTVSFFVLSLILSWAAIISSKSAHHEGAIERLMWGVAILDSILPLGLIFLYLLSGNLY